MLIRRGLRTKCRGVATGDVLVMTHLVDISDYMMALKHLEMRKVAGDTIPLGLGSLYGEIGNQHNQPTLVTENTG